MVLIRLGELFKRGKEEVRMERERENKYEIGMEMCWEREDLGEEVGGGYDQDTLWFA